MKILNRVCPRCGKDNLRLDFYDANHWVVLSCARERKILGASLLSEIEFSPSTNESFDKQIHVQIGLN